MIKALLGFLAVQTKEGFTEIIGQGRPIAPSIVTDAPADDSARPHLNTLSRATGHPTPRVKTFS
jgi:hypothetical protein